jgi:hypothetical protein
MQQIILLNMDPPEHTKQRGIVSRGFTPRAIGSLRQALTDRAERIVAAALEDGTGTSSPTSRRSCRCRRSASCSASRRRTEARFSPGRTG